MDDSTQTGSLTSNLSEHPQKVNGLVGITLGTIIQSIATLVAGWILGLVYVWRLGFFAIGERITTPHPDVNLYIRLQHAPPFWCPPDIFIS